MPNIQASGNPATTLTGSVNIQSKSTFTVTGAAVGTSETTISVPAGTKAFKLQAANSAGAAVLTIAGSSTETGSEITSFDIYAGSSYSEEFLDGTGFTIYIKSSKPATSVQLLLWS